jgi:NADH dehydrogenase/NADH:ubiquinone oxidoreductase subunit G
MDVSDSHPFIVLFIAQAWMALKATEYGGASTNQKVGKEIVMENNENFVEQTENVEQTTEQTPVTFTQEDVDRMVKEKLDQVLPGKIARREARIRKEYDRKYGDLEGVLKAGMGKDDVGEITEDLRNFYGSKKIKMPEKTNYTAQDIEVLAKADAAEIIRGGFDEVIEEADRLNAMGVENMTARDKAVFVALTNHIRDTETTRELSKLGVTEDEYNSKEFQDYKAMFRPDVPISKIYESYRSTKPKKEYKSMGSMKQVPEQGVKDYYSPEEIAKLSEDDLRDPKVWEAVRKSMTS